MFDHGPPKVFSKIVALSLKSSTIYVKFKQFLNNLLHTDLVLDSFYVTSLLDMKPKMSFYPAVFHSSNSSPFFRGGMDICQNR